MWWMPPWFGQYKWDVGLYLPWIRVRSSFSNVNELKGSCTASGASLGAATCTNGQCEYTACQKGYELLEGYCMPLLR
jgi:hypothetical protein